MIKLSKIEHYGVFRIKVDFEYNIEILTKIRKIKDSKWSKSHNAWHIPENKESIEGLKKIFSDINILWQEVSTDESKKNAVQTETDDKSIIAEVFDKRIFLKMPKNELDIRFIKTLKYSCWNSNKMRWEIPNYKDNIELIKKYFGNRLTNIVVKQDNTVAVKPKQNIKLEKKVIKKSPIVQYYYDSLKLKNYSNNTIDAYLPYFEHFVKYFSENEIDKLTIRQLHEYVKNIIEKQELTEIPIKHLISAIKFYYEKIKGKEKIYFPLQKKYEIKPVELKIKLDELVPFINIMRKPSEKLLILLKFHFGYSTKAIVDKTIEEVSNFLKNTSENKTNSYNLLFETLKSYIETTKSKIYLFEKEIAKQIRETELEQYILSIVSKYKIGIIYKYEIINAMEQLNFEETTKKSYYGCYLSFLKYYNFRHPATITDDEIRKYLVDIRTVKEYSSSYLNLAINSINFYYSQILKRKLNAGVIIRPKKEKLIPDVISQDEIIELIVKTENPKHKLILSILYSLGLRRQELINLKTLDIDFKRNVIIVKQGKGKKDRQLAIPANLKEQIISYLPKYKPKIYLIEGDKQGKYSATSVMNVVKDAARRACITKNVYPHILRHSIATHMLEDGIEITFIKEFLGHSDLKTTLRYTHVSNKSIQKIRNPFDNIKF